MKKQIPLSSFFTFNDKFSDITFIKNGVEYPYKLSPEAAEIVKCLYDAYEEAADGFAKKWTLTSADLKEKVSLNKSKSLSAKFKTVKDYKVLISMEKKRGTLSVYMLNFPPPEEVDVDS